MVGSEPLEVWSGSPLKRDNGDFIRTNTDNFAQLLDSGNKLVGFAQDAFPIHQTNDSRNLIVVMNNASFDEWIQSRPKRHEEAQRKSAANAAADKKSLPLESVNAYTTFQISKQPQAITARQKAPSLSLMQRDRSKLSKSSKRFSSKQTKRAIDELKVPNG